MERNDDWARWNRAQDRAAMMRVIQDARQLRPDDLNLIESGTDEETKASYAYALSILGD